MLNAIVEAPIWNLAIHSLFYEILNLSCKFFYQHVSNVLVLKHLFADNFLPFLGNRITKKIYAGLKFVTCVIITITCINFETRGRFVDFRHHVKYDAKQKASDQSFSNNFKTTYFIL